MDATQTKSQQRRERAAQRKGTARPHGQWIRSNVRLAIYLRDEFRCVYCGRDLHGAAPAEITLDHVHPWSKGGENDASNLITACRSCNCSRGARTVASYADAHTRAAVKRQTARSMKKFRALANAIIAGECTEANLPTA